MLAPGDPALRLAIAASLSTLAVIVGQRRQREPSGIPRGRRAMEECRRQRAIWRLPAFGHGQPFVESRVAVVSPRSAARARQVAMGRCRYRPR